jgi:hypothetical protein
MAENERASARRREPARPSGQAGPPRLNIIFGAQRHCVDGEREIDDTAGGESTGPGNKQIAHIVGSPVKTYAANRP